jgi:hypothetical protein
MKALTIRQPWASLIIEGGKDIENRSRATKVRGWVLVHAGLSLEPADLVLDWCEGFGVFEENDKAEDVRDILRRSAHSAGGIIGAMRIVDCVDDIGSPWFCGPFGYVIDRVVKLPFLPCKGRQGWFNVELPAEMEDLIPKA